MTAITDLSDWDKDPRLFLFTSLTAGSSHIVTATSRIETILRANRLPFQAVDTATDEKARKLWGRRAGKKKLPGLVKEGYVIADLEEIEDWNEFGELRENIGPLPPATGGASVNTVQTSLGSLRMQDAASQAAKPLPQSAPVKKSQPATAASASASKAVGSAGETAAEGPKKVATPLVGIMNAKKGEATDKSTTPSAPATTAKAVAAAAAAASTTSAASAVAEPEVAKHETVDDKSEDIDTVKESRPIETTTESEPEEIAPPAKEKSESIEADKNAEPESTAASTDDKKDTIRSSVESKPEPVAASTEAQKDAVEASEEVKPESAVASVSAEEEKDRKNEDTEPLKQTPSTPKPDPVEPAVDPAVESVSSAGTVGLSPPRGDTGEKKHRGSSVSAASPDEIKEMEEKIAIPEEDGEDAAAAETDKSVEKADGSVQT